MYHIENYEFGKITINGKTYTNDVIILPDKIKDNWWRKQGHFLQTEDLKEVFDNNVNLLIIGTGANGAMDVSEKVKEKLRKENIEFKILKTKKACELFNKKEDAVAALHLTC